GSAAIACSCAVDSARAPGGLPGAGQLPRSTATSTPSGRSTSAPRRDEQSSPLSNTCGPTPAVEQAPGPGKLDCPRLGCGVNGGDPARSTVDGPESGSSGGISGQGEVGCRATLTRTVLSPCAVSRVSCATTRSRSLSPAKPAVRPGGSSLVNN